MKSQNGWTASPDRADIGVRPFTVAGIEFPGGVRGGGVALVLTYLVSAFHTRVEPLVAGWCWGYAYRAISGSNTVSNHGSGTAVDINAPRHPLGVKNTFTPAKVKAIRAILRELEGVVRWGGDYTGRVDEMHFEINGTLADVDRVAAHLINKGVKDMELNDKFDRAKWNRTSGTVGHMFENLMQDSDALRKMNTDLAAKVDKLTKAVADLTALVKK